MYCPTQTPTVKKLSYWQLHLRDPMFWCEQGYWARISSLIYSIFPPTTFPNHIKKCFGAQRQHDKINQQIIARVLIPGYAQMLCNIYIPQSYHPPHKAHSVILSAGDTNGSSIRLMAKSLHRILSIWLASFHNTLISHDHMGTRQLTKH
jgi:hypothetical protein